MTLRANSDCFEHSIFTSDYYTPDADKFAHWKITPIAGKDSTYKIVNVGKQLAGCDAVLTFNRRYITVNAESDDNPYQQWFMAKFIPQTWVIFEPEFTARTATVEQIIHSLTDTLRAPLTQKKCADDYYVESWFADTSDLFTAHKNYKIKIVGDALTI